MAELIKGNASPRIENGVLYFHEGDTFVLTLHLALKNMGLPVAPEEITKITLMIRDALNKVVYFETMDADGSGSASFVFTPSVSAEFRKGRYNYDVSVQTGWERTTVADNLSCVVV